MTKLLQESTNESVHAMKKMIYDLLAEARDLTQQARKFSWFALLHRQQFCLALVLDNVDEEKSNSATMLFLIFFRQLKGHLEY